MASTRTKRSKWTEEQTGIFVKLVELNNDRLNNRSNGSTSDVWGEILSHMQLMYGDAFSEMDTKKLKTKWRKLKMQNNSNERLSKYSLAFETSNISMFRKKMSQIEKRVGNAENICNIDESLNFPILSVKKEKLSNENEQIMEGIQEVEKIDQIVENQNKNAEELVEKIVAPEIEQSVIEENLVTDSEAVLEKCNSIDELKMKILLTEKSAMETIWLTAQINKIIAVRKLKKLFHEENNDTE